jgi:rod shape-determining protein MreD
VRAYLLLALAVLLQLTVLNRLMLWGAKPDLLLICVTFFGLFLGSAAGLESGFVAGAMTDLFVIDYFGMNMVIYSCVGLAAGALKNSFIKESKRTQTLLVFFCAAFSLSLHFVITAIASRGTPLSFYEYLGSAIIPSSLYTSIVSIPVFVKFMEVFNLRQKEYFV